TSPLPPLFCEGQIMQPRKSVADELTATAESWASEYASPIYLQEAAGTPTGFEAVTVLEIDDPCVEICRDPAKSRFEFGSRRRCSMKTCVWLKGKRGESVNRNYPTADPKSRLLSQERRRWNASHRAADAREFSCKRVHHYVRGN